MARTKHMQQRMSQRSINQTMLEMTRMFGVEHGDKVVLNRKGIDAVLQEFERLQSTMIKMRERGGVVLIESEGHEITTYGLEGYKRH
ncbi:hypothetical protein GCM10011502_30060 [Oceanisphaera marina]|uniref:DUF4258 domain-containing protein n=1 Tax=Oceanisphaera marina TaxID=2017550 RepID=A0ABQ1J1K7_9GAMM|nr:hypothetical protein [Oceanisphaera marina]GGB55091.1 hypothetical protein GCM10011502_30060 [Oceanisphaera marina]